MTNTLTFPPVKRGRGRPKKTEEQREAERQAKQEEEARRESDPLGDIRDAAELALLAAREATDPADKVKALDSWMKCRKMLGDRANQVTADVRPEWLRFLSDLRADGLIS